MVIGEERSALEDVLVRVREKAQHYQSHDFAKSHHAALHTFFDLVQEYDTIEDFYRACVAIPLVFLGRTTRLYLLNQNQDALSLFCDSDRGLLYPPLPARQELRLSCHPVTLEGSLLVPIQRRHSLQQRGESQPLAELVMGMLEVAKGAEIDDKDRFFLRNYANSIGYNLHNRLIAQQNIHHLKFINNLVLDIEHNVISPNIYFRHLFNKLRKRLSELAKINHDCAQIQSQAKTEAYDAAACEQIQERLKNFHHNLADNHREILEYYDNYSLFLESLLRRDHFSKGQLVLRPRMCSVEKEIIKPQLDHYGSRLQEQGIKIIQPTDMLGEEIPLRVDVGLLSQVYTNLFSNAIKYTMPTLNSAGEQSKTIAYGREYLRNYFGIGHDGVKFNVFTTGEHLNDDEARLLYSDGFRGKEASSKQPGTGHGLAFIKQVVEIHGGVVGYERTKSGNNFYFILPLSSDEERRG